MKNKILLNGKKSIREINVVTILKCHHLITILKCHIVKNLKR